MTLRVLSKTQPCCEIQMPWQSWSHKTRSRWKIANRLFLQEERIKLITTIFLMKLRKAWAWLKTAIKVWLNQTLGIQTTQVCVIACKTGEQRISAAYLQQIWTCPDLLRPRIALMTLALKDSICNRKLQTPWSHQVCLSHLTLSQAQECQKSKPWAILWIVQE